jgi:hypothetical protein
MPALAAKKRPATSPVDLYAEIARIQDEIDAYVDKRTAEVKLANPGLPAQMIRRDLTLRFHCPCKAAMGMIEEEIKEKERLNNGC